MPADTAEHVVATLTPQNWNSALGNLLGWSVLMTGSATGTVTFRVRQGTAITGTQVGTSVVQSTVAAQVNTPALDFPDTSAFGLAQQGGQYVLTAQGSVNSVATLNSALLELETIAPLI
jgi:hypothetical protein